VFKIWDGEFADPSLTFNKAPSYSPISHFAHFYYLSFGEWVEELETDRLNPVVW
jgi:hypothetical protein